MSPRLAAANALALVMAGKASLGTSLPGQLKQVAPRDHPLTQELAFGTARWFFRLDALSSRLLDKPLKAADRDLQALLLVGLYQLLYTRIPAHAAIDETVSAAKSLKKPWAKGMLNAVLRRVQAPYPVAAPVAGLALAALTPEALAQTRSRVGRTLVLRDQVGRWLRDLPGVRAVYASDANFLLVRAEDPDGMLASLVGAGVVVRDLRHQPGLPDALRVTIGTDTEMEQVRLALGATPAATAPGPPGSVDPTNVEPTPTPRTQEPTR